MLQTFLKFNQWGWHWVSLASPYALTVASASLIYLYYIFCICMFYVHCEIGTDQIEYTENQN